LLTNLSFAQVTIKKIVPQTTKFTMDNCIYKFNKKKAAKTTDSYGITNAGDTELKYLIITKYLNGEK
jgi:hypothetical protein